MHLQNTLKPSYIAYYRVSTQRQGKSGLGLDAQQKSVLDFISAENGELIGQFTEVESGRKTSKKRPQLNMAIDHTKATGATLVIAKLDRLARNMAFKAKVGIRVGYCHSNSKNT